MSIKAPLSMQFFQQLFLSKLDTLAHVLDVSAEHFQQCDSLLSERLVEDMLPFGTQIAFTCNQPRNFVRWCQDLAMDNLPMEVTNLAQAKEMIERTKAELAAVTVDDEKLSQIRRVNLTDSQFMELLGVEYVNDFLIPNCYFHLVTAYNIMRMKGVPLGKANYMMHLLPKVQVTQP